MKPKTIAIGTAIGIAVAVLVSTSGLAASVEERTMKDDTSLKDWVFSDADCEVVCLACTVEGFVMGLSCPGPGSWVNCGPDGTNGCKCEWGCI